MQSLRYPAQAHLPALPISPNCFNRLTPLVNLSERLD